MNRLPLLLALGLAGCPFTPEDLELTAGSPPPNGGPGGGGGGAPGAGGPMGEPDINSLIAQHSQEDIRAGEHALVTGTVAGDCPARVRIDALNGRPGAGGPPPAPVGEAGGPPAKDGAPGADAPPKDAPPPDGAGGPPPPDGAGGPPPDGAGAPPQGGGGGGGGGHGPITTHYIDQVGAFEMAVPTGRPIRLSAFCDGDGDGYLTQSVDRISPPVELGVTKGPVSDVTLTLEPPRMPEGANQPSGAAGPGGPPGGAGGPPGGPPEGAGGPPEGGPPGPGAPPPPQ